jgi:predicted phage terminase large subunit-like protein
MRSHEFIEGTWPGELLESLALRAITEQCDNLRNGVIQNLAIWTPPGLGKSLTLERVAALLIAEDPCIHVGVISYADDIARRCSRAVRNLLEHPWVTERFPGLQFGSENETGWQMKTPGQDGRLTCVPRGILSSITGHRFDWTLIDDPVKNWADAWSEKIQTRTYENYVSAVVTRSSVFGKQIIIQTRWNARDLSGQVISLAEENPKAPQWRVLCLAATNDDAGDGCGRDSYIYDTRTREYQYLKAYASVFPKLFPREWLNERKATVGEAVWNALYMGSPLPGESQLFPPDCWKQIDGVNSDYILQIVTAWDLSAGKHDLSANVVLAQMRGGGYVVLDCFARKLAFNELPQIIAARHDLITQQYGFRPVLAIEDASAGTQAIDVLRARRPDIPLIPITPVKSKEERGLSVSHFVNAGVVGLAPGDWREAFIEELACFPGGGRFDDRADAFIHGLRCFISNRDTHDPRRNFNAQMMLAPGRNRAQLNETLADLDAVEDYLAEHEYQQSGGYLGEF